MPITWKPIPVPQEVHAVVKTQSEREGSAMWKIVVKAIELYTTLQRKHWNIDVNPDAQKIDRLAWYIYKLTASIGAYRESPSMKRRRLIEKTLEQIRERIGVDTSELELVIEQYFKKPLRQNRTLLNETTKKLIINMIIKELGGEE